jgi:hypothetical protein
MDARLVVKNAGLVPLQDRRADVSRELHVDVLVDEDADSRTFSPYSPPPLSAGTACEGRRRQSEPQETERRPGRQRTRTPPNVFTQVIHDGLKRAEREILKPPYPYNKAGAVPSSSWSARRVMVIFASVG